MNDIEATAYHEAGHAVIGVLNRHTPRYVTIAPRRAGLDGLSRHRTQTRAHEPSRTLIESAIMTSLAGQMAEERATGHPSTGSDHDDEAVADLALRYHHDEGVRDAFVAWLTERTRCDLDTYWPAIELVATMLLWNERLTGAEVRAAVHSTFVRAGSLVLTTDPEVSRS